ncbi:hypothetical protein MVES_000712 [Malassezia vespertilionis]|uniref:Uncharacterized protein n=1 Tax=Malassezia vespertilionis TaxID=2020962 RepID=A0A2N1JGE2_9BASI|nr:hypothetical protein MVES_000712 [Malassezia vespertilionis]
MQDPTADQSGMQQPWWEPPLAQEIMHLPTDAVQIDLTADDDDDEPILVETRMGSVPVTTTQPRRNAYVPRGASLQDNWVCIGMITPSVLCIHGLPPELQSSFPGSFDTSDPEWAHSSFLGEPGYVPVMIHKRISDPLLDHMQRSPGLSVATVSSSHGTGPRIRTEFGELADKFSRVLEHFMSRSHMVHYSRCKMATPARAAAFTHIIETLLFVPMDLAATVGTTLAHAGIFLDPFLTYRASDFPGMPKLMDIVHVQPPLRNRVRARVPDTARRLEGLGAPVTKETLEQEYKAQMSAIYNSITNSESLQETEPDACITTPLFPHQKQALTFLMDREKERNFEELIDTDKDAHISLWSVERHIGQRIQRYRNIVTRTSVTKRPEICRGALLADDMGLGKTISIIALVAKTFGEARAFGASPLPRFNYDSDDEPQLIGDSKNRRTAEQARCEGLRCRSRATLLVCPLSVISNWESQIREHWAPDKQPSVYVYHGTGRTSDPSLLADYDIVLTTYSTLGTEFANQSSWIAAAGKGDRELELDSANAKRRRPNEAPNTCQRIEWFRIVLDEAHIIKEARTWQSKSVCNLSASRRICLTGTPIQNKIDDLFALVLFMRLDPFSQRHTWNRFCRDRKHLFLNQARTKDDELLDPESLARVQTIMKFLTLRRMKTDSRPDGQPLLTLPAKTSRIVRLAFSDAELVKYKRLHDRFKEEFQEHVAEGTVGINYATILHEILVLRMMCDHSDLVDAGLASHGGPLAKISSAIREQGFTRERAAMLYSALSQVAMALCAVCGADLQNPMPHVQPEEGMDSAAGPLPIITKCEHLICSSCWPHGEQGEQGACPCCATSLVLLSDTARLQPDEMKITSEETSPQGSQLLAMLHTKELAAEAKALFDPDSPATWPAHWSSKMRALIADLLPFSKCNKKSALYDAYAPIFTHHVQASDQGTHVVQVQTQSSTPEAPIKSVVFSQWTRMLSKISGALDYAGIKHRRLDGTMSRAQREEALESFRNDPGVEVFLVSLRAGGFGLNLVSACRAYLMEPYWNPAVENQGLDRIYRLGQTRPVLMTKFIVERSIEEQMLVLQRRKMELANQVASQETTKRRN